MVYTILFLTTHDNMKFTKISSSHWWRILKKYLIVAFKNEKLREMMAIDQQVKSKIEAPEGMDTRQMWVRFSEYLKRKFVIVLIGGRFQFFSLKLLNKFCGWSLEFLSDTVTRHLIWIYWYDRETKRWPARYVNPTRVICRMVNANW